MIALRTASVLFGLGLLAWGASGNAQTEQSASTRKIANRVMPQYPSLARPLNLSGKVRFEALVAPDGTVKNLHARGGNAVFVRAAEVSLREWKWEKSNQETTEVIEFNFTP